MRVKDFQIKNFRCILDSNNINLSSDLTTLIGANESGKTNALLGFNSLNINYEYSISDLCTFSDLWELRRAGKIKNKDIEMMIVTFELENNDKNYLKKIHPVFKKVDQIKCIKYFDDEYYFEIKNYDLEELFDEEKKLKSDNILISAENSLNSFKDNFHEYFTPIGSEDTGDSFNEAKNTIMSILKGEINYSGDYYSILSHLASKHQPAADAYTELVNHLEQCKSELTEINENDLFLFEDLMAALPNFEYVEGYEELKDSYNLDEFLPNRKDYETLDKLETVKNLGVFEICGFL